MDDKEVDDILSREEDFTPFDLEVEQVENICGDAGDVKPPAQIFDELPKPLGDDIPVEFNLMVNKVHAIYQSFPRIDHDATYEELSTLSVRTIPTPTLQLINQQMQKVQAVKERVAEIVKDLTRVHVFKKRQVDILKDAWIHFSKEKSADKRKADAVYRLSEFESDYLAVDALWRTANQILNNLASTQDILSRRITSVGLELKMMDLGRHSIPDYEFRGISLDNEIGDPVVGEGFAPESNLEGGEPLEAEEMSF